MINSMQTVHITRKLETNLKKISNIQKLFFGTKEHWKFYENPRFKMDFVALFGGQLKNNPTISETLLFLLHKKKGTRK